MRVSNEAAATTIAGQRLENVQGVAESGQPNQVRGEAGQIIRGKKVGALRESPLDAGLDTPAVRVRWPSGPRGVIRRDVAECLEDRFKAVGELDRTGETVGTDLEDEWLIRAVNAGGTCRREQANNGDDERETAHENRPSAIRLRIRGRRSRSC